MGKQKSSGHDSEKKSRKKEPKFDWNEQPSGQSDFRLRRPDLLRDISQEEDDDDVDLPRMRQPRMFNPSEPVKKKKSGSQRKSEDQGK